MLQVINWPPLGFVMKGFLCILSALAIAERRRQNQKRHSLCSNPAYSTNFVTGRARELYCAAANSVTTSINVEKVLLTAHRIHIDFHRSVHHASVLGFYISSRLVRKKRASASFIMTALRGSRLYYAKENIFRQVRRPCLLD
ncbi:hypothetical protein TNCV_936001 [Trichonephila clavipes]|nr:hypothetical protein TNCV_936001 [Trichonephila clavipes]